jgi:hypothetical protein
LVDNHNGFGYDENNEALPVMAAPGCAIEIAEPREKGRLFLFVYKQYCYCHNA